jgi:hypothetical protein
MNTGDDVMSGNPVAVAPEGTRPLELVVVTYPCETAARLLKQLRLEGFRVRAVVLERKNSIAGLCRVWRVVGTRRTLCLLRGRLKGRLGLTGVEQWRTSSFYVDLADEVIVVPDLNGRASRDALRRLSPDVAVIGGAGILRPGVFDIPRFGTLNVHPGLLPRYRGCSTVCWALAEGGDTGVTVHLVDSRIDTGPIVAQRVVRVLPGETLPVFARRLFAEGIELVTQALGSLARGEPFTAVEQSREGSRYYRMAPPAVRHFAEQKLAELAKTASGNDRWQEQDSR